MKTTRGRPKSETKTVRISPHFPEPVADTIHQAAQFSGITTTAFVLQAAKEAAEEMVRQQARWQLNTEEAETIAKLLKNPPACNAEARKAEKLANDVQIRS